MDPTLPARPSCRRRFLRLSQSSSTFIDTRQMESEISGGGSESPPASAPRGRMRTKTDQNWKPN